MTDTKALIAAAKRRHDKSKDTILGCRDEHDEEGGGHVLCLAYALALALERAMESACGNCESIPCICGDTR